MSDNDRPEYRLRYHRFFHHTEPPTEALGQDYKWEFEVDLGRRFENIVSIELEEWALPASISHPFNRNNAFEIELSGPSLPTKTLELSFPERYLTYHSMSNPSISYVATLASLLNQAVDNDSDYNGKVIFTCPLSSTSRTMIFARTVTGSATGLSAGDITFKIKFDLNDENSPHTQMGFIKAEYASESNQSIPQLDVLQAVLSPSSTTLHPLRYIDLYLKEWNFGEEASIPFHRIYTNPYYPHTTKNVSHGNPGLVLRVNEETKARYLHFTVKTKTNFLVDVRDRFDFTFGFYYLDPVGDKDSDMYKICDPEILLMY